jgi:hypothetical protein
MTDVKQESDGRWSFTDKNGTKRTFSTREEAEKAQQAEQADGTSGRSDPNTSGGQENKS